jgi:predicted nucleic-acid-binding Zn-ribbon protein
MTQFLISSLKQINCTLSGHDISVEDEKNLFKCQEKYLNIKCIRCNYPLLLRMDPSDIEENTYMIMEKNN